MKKSEVIALLEANEQLMGSNEQRFVIEDIETGHHDEFFEDEDEEEK